MRFFTRNTLYTLVDGGDGLFLIAGHPTYCPTPTRVELDLLLASPECTHHSNARGGKPVSDQSRASRKEDMAGQVLVRGRCLLSAPDSPDSWADFDWFSGSISRRSDRSGSVRSQFRGCSWYFDIGAASSFWL